MKCVRGNQQTIYTIYVCHYHVQVYMLSHTGLHTITHRSTHYHIQVYTLTHTGLHTITYRSACHITYRSTCRHKQVYTAMCFMLKIKHHQKWPWQASNPPLQCSGHEVVQANTHTHTHTHLSCCRLPMWIMSSPFGGIYTHKHHSHSLLIVILNFHVVFHWQRRPTQ